MKFAYKEIEEAFEFVGAGDMYSHTAIVDIQTGKVLFQSESGDLDEFPDDINPERYRSIPHKKEIGLARPLVMSFIAEHIPHAYEEVQHLFSRKGAYSRFKAFLEANNQLNQWYAYEEQGTEKAIREWCQEQGIELIG